MSDWHDNKWQDKAQAVAADTREALQTVYDALNQGQRQKMMKDEKIKALFERYKVVTE